MALTFEFLALIVRVEAIETKFPGGLAAAVAGRDTPYPQHDGHLFIGGEAMNPADIDDDVRWWESQGLDAGRRDADGRVIEWLDMCVIGVTNRLPLKNCTWLVGNALKEGV